MISRLDLQVLAQGKVDDAELLFQAKRYSNAYYLFGYGVELALKSRIALTFLPETIPDLAYVRGIFTHRLIDLVGHAGLTESLRQAREGSPEFDSRWAVVVEWSEQSRYEIIDEARATAMRNAMLAEQDGIFEWLRRNC